jgi:hypothetical protein
VGALALLFVSACGQSPPEEVVVIDGDIPLVVKHNPQTGTRGDWKVVAWTLAESYGPGATVTVYVRLCPEKGARKPPKAKVVCRLVPVEGGRNLENHSEPVFYPLAESIKKKQREFTRQNGDFLPSEEVVEKDTNCWQATIRPFSAPAYSQPQVRYRDMKSDLYRLTVVVSLEGQPELVLQSMPIEVIPRGGH